MEKTIEISFQKFFGIKNEIHLIALTYPINHDIKTSTKFQYQRENFIICKMALYNHFNLTLHNTT